MRLFLYFFNLFIVSLFCNVAVSQPDVSIAKWKNGATACYNIIHDDFGEQVVIGINNYADTMNFNRGLKITFGAISKSCEINHMYPKAISMVKDHGHEIINHSHTHSCAVTNGWCEAGGINGGWSQPSTNKMNVEIDQSSKSISENTGYTPRFFIYPFDEYSTTANNYLKTKGYIGARTGTRHRVGSSEFEADEDGFFTPDFVVDATDQSADNLNYWVDQAIDSRGWVNRELHNIGDNGWGHVSEHDYRTHLDYVKSQVDEGQLWVGTISEILTYQLQKLNYSPSSSYNSIDESITVNWSSSHLYDVPNYLSPLQFKSPITLVVDLVNYPGTYTVEQNNNVITDEFIKGSKMYINVYPNLGPVKLTKLPLSVLTPASKNGLRFYPNPTSERIYVNNTSIAYNVEIADAVGKVILKGVLNENGLDVSSLPKGLYVLKVEGKGTYVSTFLKE
jgi:hypothetical protein